MYVDVHSHLYHPAFDNILNDSIINAKKVGVTKIIVSGIDKETNRKAIELQNKYDIISASLGIYPPDALKKEYKEENKDYVDFDIDKEIDFIKKQKPIAIGEVGLEYKYGNNKELQMKIFDKMIDIAIQLNVPLIVHSRNAELDTINLLERKNAKKVVMHCFNGKLSLAKRVEKNGWFLSIPTNIVNSAQMQLLAKTIDISKLLTETDAPFLGPNRIFPNEPKFVQLSVNKIAEIKKLNEKEVKEIIYMNYRKLFG